MGDSSGNITVAIGFVHVCATVENTPSGRWYKDIAGKRRATLIATCVLITLVFKHTWGSNCLLA